MATKKKAAELAKLDQFTPEMAPQLLELVNTKLKALKGTGEKSQSTKGDSFPGTSQQICHMTDVAELILLVGHIQKKAEAYELGKKTLGLKVAIPEFKIGNHKPEAWIADIKSRIQEVVHKDQIAQLEKAKALYEECLSEEEKKAVAMKKAFDELTKSGLVGE